MNVYMYMCIYAYIKRDREKERETLLPIAYSLPLLQLLFLLWLLLTLLIEFLDWLLCRPGFMATLAELLIEGALFTESPEV